MIDHLFHHMQDSLYLNFIPLKENGRNIILRHYNVRKSIDYIFDRVF